MTQTRELKHPHMHVKQLKSDANIMKLSVIVESNELAVHNNIECDECLMSPLVGNRYKCTQCPNYDLCQNCLEKKVHKHHALVLMPNNNCCNMVDTDVSDCCSDSSCSFGLKDDENLYSHMATYSRQHSSAAAGSSQKTIFRTWNSEKRAEFDLADNEVHVVSRDIRPSSSSKFYNNINANTGSKEDEYGVSTSASIYVDAEDQSCDSNAPECSTSSQENWELDSDDSETEMSTNILERDEQDLHSDNDSILESFIFL